MYEELRCHPEASVGMTLAGRGVIEGRRQDDEILAAFQ